MAMELSSVSAMFRDSIQGYVNLPRTLLLIIAALGLYLLSVPIVTTIQYRRALRSYRHATSKDVLSAPHLPYRIPFLGSALSFLKKTPGGFFDPLMKTHPMETSVVKMLMGGKSIHLTWEPKVVEQLFKLKEYNMEEFLTQIVHSAFGISVRDMRTYYGWDEASAAKRKTVKRDPEKCFHEFLLKTAHVNELTTTFISSLEGQLATVSGLSDGESLEINLYSLIRKTMFTASITALFGTRLLEMYPDMETPFYKFDEKMLDLFFGIPRLMIPQVYAARDRLRGNFEAWHERVLSETKEIVSPDEVAWEPRYGSRLNRARQIYYAEMDLTLAGRASLDFGFVFGLNSNAIPATGWLVLHILQDAQLYRDVMAEIKLAVKPDSSVDVPELMRQPLYTSVYHEVLRCYVDTLVTRELTSDLFIPGHSKPRTTDTSDAKQPSGDNATGSPSIFLPAGSTVIASSYMTHRSPIWNSSSEAPLSLPPTSFHPRRFLKSPSSTSSTDSAPTFTLNNVSTALLPFGGGRSMCPGRVFAKQEVLASAAIFLLSYEMEVLEVVNEREGEEWKGLPKLKDGYPGTGINPIGGDLKVRIKQKDRRAVSA